MKKLVFFITLSATLVACSPKAEQAAKVYGRYVPERKDDFAWENEYAAFRMYGPALAPENPSNGVDLWLKNSPALAIDTMYGRELKDDRPYHINYDGNLDCYKVGHTAGCGGLVVAVDAEDPGEYAGQLFVGGPYSTWEILEQTPDQFVFRLHYDSLQVAYARLEADVTITVEAGKMLNKAEVVLMCPAKIRLPKFYVGGGIYLHDGADSARMTNCEACGMIALAEDALSDKTAAQMNFDHNGSTTQGSNYIAVVTPGATWQDILGEEGAQTYVSMKEYELGDTLTYYFGACWSEWSNGELSFPTDESWFNFVRNEVRSYIVNQ